LKFGSSVTRTAQELPNVVHEIYRWYRTGQRVIVVAALGLTTDEVVTALDRSGVPARSLDPHEIGLTTTSSSLAESERASVDVSRVQELLKQHPVLVVPVGSGLTAAALAHALSPSRCRLITDPTRAAGERSASEPSRVLLLGLGTVGFGVYQRLLANPEHFQVVGILVRDRGKYERLGIPSGLLRSRIDQVLRLRADLVIDALPDPEVARPIAEHFLATGGGIVSAGKGLIAKFGLELTELAERCGGTLSYSAAVGGAAPMVEAVERCTRQGPIAALTGVLNGTCNFVLDRCAQGTTLQDALGDATRAGFAEAESHDDLSGQDAARKITILSRVAFGAEARLVEIQTLDDSIAEHAHQVAAYGLRLRQIVRAAPCADEVHATVRFEAMPAESPLGRLRDEWNALQIFTQLGGLHTVTGRGAGRWPTAEAVMGDVLEARRALLGLKSLRGPLSLSERS
jgi:homoserine dehydrogenase